MTDYLKADFDWTKPPMVAVVDELSLWSAAHGLLLLEHVPMRPNARLLDVGCGTGFPLLELAQRLGPTCRAWGVDPWAAALKRVQEKCRRFGIRNVKVIEADAGRMPFDDGSFDLIVSNLGINNFAEAEAALRKCHAVAAPGCTLALTTNLQGHMQAFYDTFAESLARLGLDRYQEPLRVHVAHRATVAGLQGQLAAAGFEPVRAVTRDWSLRFVDGSSLLRHGFIQLAFLPAWRQLIDPADRLDVFERLEADLNALAHRGGGLSLRIPMAYVEARKAGG